MRRLIVALVLFSVISVNAQAACYTPEQFRAEQAIRYHTRLMVLGMLCKGVLKQNTYADYQSFTKRNQSVINEQENRLVGYFKQTRQPNPERALHSLRTDLANRISVQATRSVVAFCQYYTKEWRQSKSMTPLSFKQWIASLNWQKTTETSRPVCGATQK